MQHPIVQVDPDDPDLLVFGGGRQDPPRRVDDHSGRMGRGGGDVVAVPPGPPPQRDGRGGVRAEGHELGVLIGQGLPAFLERDVPAYLHAHPAEVEIEDGELAPRRHAALQGPVRPHYGECLVVDADRIAVAIEDHDAVVDPAVAAQQHGRRRIGAELPRLLGDRRDERAVERLGHLLDVLLDELEAALRQDRQVQAPPVLLRPAGHAVNHGQALGDELALIGGSQLPERAGADHRRTRPVLACTHPKLLLWNAGQARCRRRPGAR